MVWCNIAYFKFYFLECSENSINNCPPCDQTAEVGHLVQLSKRFRTDKDWRIYKTYENKKDAEAELPTMMQWSKITANETAAGYVCLYRCNKVKARGKQCQSGAKLLYHSTDPGVTLFLSGKLNSN
jgi:hypothetical protein